MPARSTTLVSGGDSSLVAHQSAGRMFDHELRTARGAARFPTPPASRLLAPLAVRPGRDGSVFAQPGIADPSGRVQNGGRVNALVQGLQFRRINSGKADDEPPVAAVVVQD